MRYFLVSAFVFLSTLVLQASALEVTLKNNVFYAPATGTYVETDMLIAGNSVDYIKNADGKFNGALEVLLLFKRRDTIVNYDKYVLHTPCIFDTANITTNLVDKKRYTLPPGIYAMDATFTDLHNKKQKHIIRSFTITFDSNKIQFSDISLLSVATKVNDVIKAANDPAINKEFMRGDLYMLPMVFDFFPASANTLRFYTEVYNVNSDSGNLLSVNYGIRNDEMQEQLSGFSSLQKIKPSSLVSLFGELDISDLPSGNYELVLQVKDERDSVLCRKELPFERSKEENGSVDDKTGRHYMDQLDVPSLRYQMRTLEPIANFTEAAEIKILSHSMDVDSLKQFLFTFWTARDFVDPYLTWGKYEAQVEQVNKQFGTPIYYGFETDRGRVYLEYGPPNQLNDHRNEPSAYPYQVWLYYHIPRQRNAIFVFYNRDMVTNSYELIHSTALDEVRDYDWEKMVNVDGNNFSQSDYSPHLLHNMFQR